MIGRRTSNMNSARRKGSPTMLGVLLFLLPAAGAYAVHARNHAGRGSRPVPTPSIRAKPASKTSQTSALFRFTDTQRGVTFKCSLDGSALKSCQSPMRYGVVEETVTRCTKTHGKPKHCKRTTKHHGSPLAPGSHTFRAVASSSQGSLSQPASYTWVIEAQTPPATPSSPTASPPSSSTGRSFSTSGSPSGSLYPGGPALPIPLTLHNPNDEPIYVTSLTVAVTSSLAGCESATNINLTQSSASPLTPVLIQPNGSVTLSTQSVSAPTVQLVELLANQDACKGATFSLSYTGSAHS